MSEELTLNQRIEIFLKSKNISQQLVANKLSVNRQTVNNWISGHSQIPVKHVIRLLFEFENLNPRWLLLGMGEMEGDEQATPVDESIALTKRDIKIDLLTEQLLEKDKIISELQREIGRMEVRQDLRKL